MPIMKFTRRPDGSAVAWRFVDAAPNPDFFYRVAQIDDDRYSGAYSGSPFTAWPGAKPDAVDAGDGTCEEFWRDHGDTLHGRGDSPQAALKDLLAKIDEAGCWDSDMLKLVMFEPIGGYESAYLVTGSPEFEKWMTE